MLKRLFCLSFFITSFSLCASEQEEIKIIPIYEYGFPEKSKVIDEAIANWHKANQEEIKKLDEHFHPKHLKGNTPNLAFLNIQLKTEKETIDINFEKTVFISGKSIKVASSGERPSWDFGVIKDFDDNTYNLSLHYAPAKSKEISEEGLKNEVRKNSFLSRYNEQTENNTLICIEDFYKDTHAYHKALMGYFGLQTTLDQKFGNMEKKFINFLENFYAGNEKISISAMKEITSKVPDFIVHDTFHSFHKKFL